MKAQQDRDQQAVTIATALALFAVALVLGTIALLVVARTHLSDSEQRTFLVVAVPTAAAIGGWYLVRHPRP